MGGGGNVPLIVQFSTQEWVTLMSLHRGKNRIDLWSVSLKGLGAQRMGAGLGIKSCSISLVLFCNYWTDLFRWSWNSKIMLLWYRQVEHESLFSF